MRYVAINLVGSTLFLFAVGLIYAVTGTVLDTGEELKGAANIGIRPQFEPPIELLEPHFFDFSADLYGREVEVQFRHFLRPEAKFDSLVVPVLGEARAREITHACRELGAAADVRRLTSLCRP